MSASISTEPKKKIIKTRKPLPAEDVEPERSPTPPPLIAPEMTKFFEENPDDFDEDALKEQIKNALSKTKTKTKKPKVDTKGVSKAELKGYSSTAEAEALGFFSKGDTCDGCGKVFNRKFYKAYHFISKDNQTCDGKVKRSNGKAVRPVAVKPKDWVASWSETAVEFGLIDEPLTFTSKDLTRWILNEEYKEELDEVITLKPFKKKLAHFLNNKNIVEKTTYETDDGEQFVKCVGDYQLIEIVNDKEWFGDKWMDIREYCGY
jgi:hypothetical protein